MKAILFRPDFIIVAISLVLTACSMDEDRIYFSPYPKLPDVVTYAPEDVTMATANLCGQIFSQGSGPVIESGIYIYKSGISSEPDPELNEEFIEKRCTEDTSEGSFTIFLRDLKANTTYHYRAFATNYVGTAFGELKVLVTSYSAVGDQEANVYQTVKIGEQVWMRENLRSNKYSDGTCNNGCYDQAKVHIYGNLYTWQTSIKTYDESIGVCPVGWHIPSDAEWQKLLEYTGIPYNQLNVFGLIGSDQALMLKESGTEHWGNSEINNRTGFSALPAGVCPREGEKISLSAAFWTSTPFVFYGFQNESEKITRGKHPTGKCGFSIRCVKD